jgi:hypothetical protein
MDAAMRQEAAGIEAAQVMEIYLRQKYSINQRELLERYIAVGRPLPERTCRDPLIKGYLATLPQLLPILREAGFIKPYRERMMTSFMIRTMTPTAPGYQGICSGAGTARAWHPASRCRAVLLRCGIRAEPTGG